MRGLMVAVVGMGVLIVAGVTVLAVELIHRVSGAAAPGVGEPGVRESGIAASMVLDQPAGTRIVGVSLGADRLAVTLTGGGPDRAVILDVKSGRAVGTVTLAR